MGKFDKNILSLLSERNIFDSRLAYVLSQNDRIDALVRVRNPLHFGVLEHNFEITHTYPFIRTVGIKCGLKEAILLERMQEVEYVSAQSAVFALSEAKSELETSDSDNAAAKTEFERSEKIFALSKELDGSGVTMCVMDTGISPHIDLSVPKERIVHFVDMINGENEPYDDNGHGTFVAGVAVGNGLMSGGEVIGVAPKANVVGIKVIGKSGESGTFKILDGMQWLFDNYRRYGIKVVCMSFGAEPLPYADPLKIGVEMLTRSGIIVVAASGNSGENTVKSPAISSEIIAVGAVDSNDNIAQFTSRGVYQGATRPDVYADGVDVVGLRAGGTYAGMSGTSVSAPYIAGACCLLCQKYKNITPYQAKSVILNNSVIVNGIRIFR